MRLLFLSHSDYGNSGALFARAMAGAGHEVVALTERPHVFEYPHQMQTWPQARWENDIQGLVDWADVINVVQSDLPGRLGGEYPMPEYVEEMKRIARGITIIGWPAASIHRARSSDHNHARDKWLNYIKRKPVVVFHGNSFLRQVPEAYQFWRGVADYHVMYEGDLVGLGLEPAQVVLPPVDIDMLAPRDRTDHDKVVIGHFPSSSKTKGTPEIMFTLFQWLNDHPELADRFEIRNAEWVDDAGNPTGPGVKTVPWREQVERMAACDVIIDQIKPFLNGKRFGEWVSCATEAAALGCITIANSHTVPLYEETYGRRPGLHVCNTPDDLYAELTQLALMSREEIRAEQKATRRWIEQCHAFEPTARIMEGIYEKVLPACRTLQFDGVTA